VDLLHQHRSVHPGERPQQVCVSPKQCDPVDDPAMTLSALFEVAKRRNPVVFWEAIALDDCCFGLDPVQVRFG
jgi:hypothetical protein